MTLDQIGEILGEIRADIKVMKRDLTEDYKQLHGNGQPGLISKHQDLELRVDRLERSLHDIKESKKSRVTLIVGLIGHAIAIGAAIIAYLK